MEAWRAETVEAALPVPAGAPDTHALQALVHVTALTPAPLLLAGLALASVPRDQDVHEVCPLVFRII